MKKLLLPFLLAMSIFSTGCLTTDYNARVVYDVDRMYVHADSTEYAMNWKTPAWREKNVKYWSSAGIIVTNWYNVFEENSWLRYVIEDGFEGTILIHQNMSAIPLALSSRPSDSFGKQFYNTAVSQSVDFQSSLSGSLIAVFDSDVVGTTSSSNAVLTMKPSAFNDHGYTHAIAQLYVNHILQAKTDLGITSSNAVNIGVMYDEYEYSDWLWGNELLAAGNSFDPTGGSTNWSQQSISAKRAYMSGPQSNFITALHAVDIPVVVKGDRLSTEMLANQDLQNARLIGYMFDDVSPQSIESTKTVASTLRSYETANSADEALLLIAGVTSDVYHASKPTDYASLVKNIVTAGMYFTPGSDGTRYWNVPLSLPGDWWIRSNEDALWQQNAPTYASNTVGLRQTMIPMSSTFGYSNMWTCDEPSSYTTYTFPTNNISTAPVDSGSIDFSFVYDEDNQTFHIIQIPGGHLNWGNFITPPKNAAWFQHFISYDLVTWQPEPNINVYDSTWAKTNAWAPNIIRHADLWYMFYTAVDATAGMAANQQRICVRTSSDLYTWSAPTLVLVANDYHANVTTPFTTYKIPAVTWGDGDCRDAHVIRNENDDGWIMFMAVGGVSAVVGNGGLVIAQAVTLDSDYSNNPALSLVGTYKMYDYVAATTNTVYGIYNGESPIVWVEDGVYHLQWSTNTGGAYINGMKVTTTTPSLGSRQSNSWTTPINFPYKAPEMLTLKNGDRIMAWLANHAVIPDYLTIGFKRYKNDATFSNLFVPSCFDGEPFFTTMSIPLQPTGLVLLEQTPTAIKLMWSAPTYGDVFSHNIYRGTSSGNLTLLANTTNLDRYFDDTLTSGQEYYYKVSALNYNGAESPLSSEVSTSSEVVVPNPTVAYFSATPLTGISPLTVSFTDESTNSPTIWSWNFGDGQLGTTQNPNHQYVNPGVYTVTLVVTNSSGASTETKVNYITVNPPTPVANFTASQSSGVVPLTVNFTDTSTNTPTSWLWNFGEDVTSTLQNPSYEYTSVGTYTVTLTATNITGTDNEIKTSFITVNPQTPVTAFSATPLSGPIPFTTQFTDASTNTPVMWSWDFGDATTSSEQNPTHEYLVSGTYTVSLVTANITGQDTETKTNYITALASTPVAAFSATPLTGQQPLEVTFTDQSTHIPTSWLWDFGDGTTSTEQNPVHTYTTAGYRTVVLTATNSSGSDSEVKGSYVVAYNPPAPIAAFSGTPLTGTAPLTITFTDASTNSPTSWSWTFGSTTLGVVGSSLAQNPQFTFTTPGIYYVALTASSEWGNDLEFKFDYITVTEPPIAPEVAFSGTPLTGTVPLTVNFTDESIGSPTSWLWDFGDGNGTTVQSPSHAYTIAGVYDVYLQVTKGVDVSSETKVGYVTVNPAPPTNVSATFNGTDTVNITWTASPSSGTKTYYVYRGFGGDKKLIKKTSSLSFADATCVPGSPHYYTVTTVINGAQSAHSTEDMEWPVVVKNFRKPFYYAGQWDDYPSTGLPQARVDSLAKFDLVGWMSHGYEGAVDEPGYVDVLARVRTAAAQLDGHEVVGITYHYACELSMYFSDTPITWSDGNSYWWGPDANHTLPRDQILGPKLWDWAIEHDALLKKPDGSWNANSSFPAVPLDWSNYEMADTLASWSVQAFRNSGYDGEYAGIFYDFYNTGVQDWTVSSRAYVDLDHDGIPHNFSSEEQAQEDIIFRGFFDRITKMTRQKFGEYGMKNRLIIWNGNGIPASSSNTAFYGDASQWVDGFMQERWNDGSIGWPGWRGNTDLTESWRNVLEDYADPTKYTRAQTRPYGFMWHVFADSSAQHMAAAPGILTNGWIHAASPVLASCLSNPAIADESCYSRAANGHNRIPAAPYRLPDPGAINGFSLIEVNPASGFRDTLVVDAENYDLKMVLKPNLGNSNIKSVWPYLVVSADGDTLARGGTWPRQLPPIPNAEFSGTPLSGTVPLTVSFTDASTNVPTSWLWNFGDSTTDTRRNVTHQYTAVGTYTVTLTATNAGGSNQETKVAYVTVLPPVPDANFSGTPLSGEAPLTVNFTDTSTNTPTSWAWTFGDGGTSTSQSPSHEYAVAGTYTVTLTATNAGGSNLETKTAYVVVSSVGTGRVTDGLLALYEFNDVSGSTVTDAQPSPLNLTIANLGNVTWGDGSLRVNTATKIVSAAANKLIDASQASDEFSIEMWLRTTSATQSGPARIFTISPDNAGAGNVMVGHGANLGTPSTGVTLRRMGTLDLEVSNTIFSSNVLTHLVYTRTASGVTTLYKNGASVGAATITGTLDSWSDGFFLSLANEYNSPTTDRPWLGEFFLVAYYSKALSASEVLQNFNYGENGTGTLLAPVAAFSGTPLSGVGPLTVTFTDASVNTPTSWLWNFGDGTTSTTQSPSHQYTVDGYYTVTLTATNASGSDSEVKTDYVFVGVTTNPTISSVTGTVANTQTLTVIGNGFESKTVPGMKIYDTLESGSFNAGWTTTDRNLGVIDATAPLRRTPYSTKHNESIFSGDRYSNKGLGDPGDPGAGSSFGTVSSNETSRYIFCGYWLKLGTGWTWGTTDTTLPDGSYDPDGDGGLSNIKWLRVWDYGNYDNWASSIHTFAGDAISSENAIYPACNINAGYTEPTTGAFGGIKAILNDGNWHHVQLEYVSSSATNAFDGMTRIWLDGNRMTEQLNIRTRLCSSTTHPRIYGLGFYDSWHDGSANPNRATPYYLYMDDIYWDNTLQRVEVGNASSYAACTLREVQPAATWTNGQITFPFNQGKHTSGTLYVFVVNTRGEKSDGFPITLP